MEKLKCALIGCGRISYKHAEGVVHNREYIELVAFCDFNKDLAEKEAEAYIKVLKEEGVVTYKEPLIFQKHEDLLREIDVDVVIIATDSGSHAQIAIDAMKRGKHVIVENRWHYLQKMLMR